MFLQTERGADFKEKNCQIRSHGKSPLIIDLRILRLILIESGNYADLPHNHVPVGTTVPVPRYCLHISSNTRKAK